MLHSMCVLIPTARDFTINCQRITSIIVISQRRHDKCKFQCVICKHYFKQTFTKFAPALHSVCPYFLLIRQHRHYLWVICQALFQICKSAKYVQVFYYSTNKNCFDFWAKKAVLTFNKRRESFQWLPLLGSA